MEYNYPKFTPEMKKTHTILIPNMAITQFRLLEYALRFDGYKCEILGNCGSAVAQLGLKYVHNDTCYPALLVIGQFLDALNSGKYDLDHTALLITQTGGGCRASNYIHLLRKALVKAGYPQIPVASLNFSGLEKDSGFQMTLPLARRAIACIFYGDLLLRPAQSGGPLREREGERRQDGGPLGRAAGPRPAGGQGLYLQRDEAYLRRSSQKSLPPSPSPVCRRSKSASSVRSTSNTARWATTTCKSSWKARTARSTSPA